MHSNRPEVLSVRPFSPTHKHACYPLSSHTHTPIHRQGYTQAHAQFVPGINAFMFLNQPEEETAKLTYISSQGDSCKNNTRPFLKCSFVSGVFSTQSKKVNVFQNQIRIWFFFFYFKVWQVQLRCACLSFFLQVGRTMQKNDRSGDDSQRDSVSRHQLPFPSSISLHHMNSSHYNIIKYHAGFHQFAAAFIIKGDMRRKPSNVTNRANMTSFHFRADLQILLELYGLLWSLMIKKITDISLDR